MKRMSVGSVFAYGYIGGIGDAGVARDSRACHGWPTTAAFQPDRDPALISLLYDLRMLSYNGSLGCFTAARIWCWPWRFSTTRTTSSRNGSATSIQIITEVIAPLRFRLRVGPVLLERLDRGSGWRSSCSPVWLRASSSCSRCRHQEPGTAPHWHWPEGTVHDPDSTAPNNAATSTSPATTMWVMVLTRHDHLRRLLHPCSPDLPQHAMPESSLAAQEHLDVNIGVVNTVTSC